MSKIKRISIIIILLLLLTGCSSTMKELNNYTIVTGILVQKTSNQYHVSMETIDLTNSFSNEALASRMIEGYGSTIEDAIASSVKLTGSDITLSYARVVLIDDTVPRSALSHDLQTLQEKFECRDKASLIRVEVPQDINILQVASKTSQGIGSYAIFNLFEGYKAQKLNVKEFISQDSPLPTIGITKVLGQQQIVILK